MAIDGSEGAAAEPMCVDMHDSGGVSCESLPTHTPKSRPGKGHNKKDLGGARFGRWLVIAETGDRDGSSVVWRCRCDCGTERNLRATRLVSGKSQSCGCLHLSRVTTHGHTRVGAISPEWTARQAMLSRCYHKRNASYDDYGGRGIRVCARWRESFENFFADMGPRPSSRHSVDRIDVHGHYEPSNCRWATIETQSRRRRSSRLTMEAVEEIRAKHAAGSRQKDLAEEYGLQHGHVSLVVNHKIWKRDRE